MIKLTIKKEDGSVYWVEHFNDAASANGWLAEEKTRPYWKASYTHQIEEIKEPQYQVDPSIEQERTARRARLKAIDFNQISTIAQLKAVVKDLLAEVGQ